MFDDPINSPDEGIRRTEKIRKKHSLARGHFGASVGHVVTLTYPFYDRKSGFHLRTVARTHDDKGQYPLVRGKRIEEKGDLGFFQKLTRCGIRKSPNTIVVDFKRSNGTNPRVILMKFNDHHTAHNAHSGLAQGYA